MANEPEHAIMWSQADPNLHPNLVGGRRADSSMCVCVCTPLCVVVRLSPRRVYVCANPSVWSSGRLLDVTEHVTALAARPAPSLPWLQGLPHGAHWCMMYAALRPCLCMHANACWCVIAHASCSEASYLGRYMCV